MRADCMMDDETLKRRYLAGEAGTDLAREMGVHSTCVYRRLRRAGVEIRPKREAMRLQRMGEPFDEAACVRLYEEGYSSTEVARMLRASKSKVLNTLHERGAAVRSKQEASRLRRNTAQRVMPKASAMRGLRECAACGIERHLEIHHVNGDRSDSRPENLIYLCWEHHLLVEYLVEQAVIHLAAVPR